MVESKESSVPEGRQEISTLGVKLERLDDIPKLKASVASVPSVHIISSLESFRAAMDTLTTSLIECNCQEKLPLVGVATICIK